VQFGKAIAFRVVVQFGKAIAFRVVVQFGKLGDRFSGGERSLCHRHLPVETVVCFYVHNSSQ